MMNEAASLLRADDPLPPRILRSEESQPLGLVTQTASILVLVVVMMATQVAFSPAQLTLSSRALHLTRVNRQKTACRPYSASAHTLTTSTSSIVR